MQCNLLLADNCLYVHAILLIHCAHKKEACLSDHVCCTLAVFFFKPIVILKIENKGLLDNNGFLLIDSVLCDRLDICTPHYKRTIFFSILWKLQ